MKYYSTNRNTPEVSLKEAVVKDLSYVSSMDVKEYTLYQKWCEVKDRYPTVETNSFFDDF